MEKVLKPWTPVKVSTDEKGVAVNVWGRSYKGGKKSFLESVISQNIEILASPIRLSGTENGEEIIWGSFNTFVMDSSDEVKAQIVTSAQSKVFVLNVNMDIEYDGVIDMSIAVMPQGRSVNAWFGLDNRKEPEYKLEQLWLEIPFKPEIAKLYHIFPNSDLIINGKNCVFDKIRQAGDLPETLEMPFKEQVFVGNDNLGFAVFFESHENMQWKDKDKAVQIIKDKNETVLRIRLLDSEPSKWIDKGMENGKELFPITYRLGMVATPVKEFDKNSYREKAVHIDCFKKIPEDYEDFLMNEFENTGEITFDRLKRLGVNTLYIHEKWNDIQNSPFLTTKTADRLKLIIREAHLRGIKVIPYFGYEISTLSPYWGKMGEEIMNRETGNNYAVHWYRYPYQRDPIVCYNSKWLDIFADGIEALMDKFGFDGIYIDSTIRPMPCCNEKHGCGYRDEDGNLHTTYPVWATRKLMKRLYEIVDSRGGIINSHGSAAYNVPALAFCHSVWEGEMIQQQLIHGEISKLPESHFRCVFTGRNFGIPVYMLCYSNPPIWTFEQAVAQSIIFGTLPKSNDVGEPLELMSQIWRFIDNFPIEDAEWKPYFENDVISSNDDIKVSYFEYGNRRLVFAANIDIEPKCTTISFGDSVFSISSAVNVKSLQNNKELSLNLKGYGFAVFEAKF